MALGLNITEDIFVLKVLNVCFYVIYLENRFMKDNEGEILKLQFKKGMHKC